MIKYRIAIAFYSLKKRRIFKAGIILLIILAIASSIFFYNKYRKAQEALKNPTASVANNETQTILEKVGKLVELPSETSTIATVTDVNKLASQPFFAKAQNGDKVLIFPKPKKQLFTDQVQIR